MSVTMGNGTFTYGDGTALGTADVPWGNVYNVPSLVYSNTKTDGNSGAGRSIAGGNITGACSNCNCSTSSYSGSYLYLDSGSAFDMYYYTYQCNCNCNCNCGKLICAKLHELGLLPTDIFISDEQFGTWLEKNRPDVFNGYTAWATMAVGWMSGDGPNVLPWIEQSRRNEIMKNWSIRWAQDVATPWAEYIAGRKTFAGKIVFHVGIPICKAVGVWQRIFGKSDKPAGFFKGMALIAAIGLFKVVVDTCRAIESYKKIPKAA
jgi:hypothetical protein